MDLFLNTNDNFYEWSLLLYSPWINKIVVAKKVWLERLYSVDWVEKKLRLSFLWLSKSLTLFLLIYIFNSKNIYLENELKILAARNSRQ